MSDDTVKAPVQDDSIRWEYRVIRVSVGPVTFQKYGPDDLDCEATLNDLGSSGWEAFHVQAFANNEALLMFLKRRVPRGS